tara:strand:- start:107 stop:799 length:693 start_codon:yes stop_codon:yes gene_type:complete
MSFLEKYNEGQTLLIDKDLEWTSFDVVKKIKFLIKCKKVGHAGTLDPLATGLLVLCTGKNTKKINDIQNQNKEYTGEFTLGKTTPSHDLETEFIESNDLDGVTEEKINDLRKNFIGEQFQRPPRFSAVKVKGKRAYQFARKNENIEIKEKKINIHEFKISEINLPNISFMISCTKGTYIRSLARDFGKALGCGAVLTKLRRTKIGEFDVKDAFKIDDFVNKINKEKIENS